MTLDSDGTETGEGSDSESESDGSTSETDGGGDGDGDGDGECGDGVVDPGEECDDGNTDETDGCTNMCLAAACDDGLLNGDESAVDCGGSCAGCSTGSSCDDGSDCASGLCQDAQCILATTKRIFTGSHHTCAILDNGRIRCWGKGEFGRLGYGNEEDIGDDEFPNTGPSLDVGASVVQLALGEAYSCALFENGAVRCWGGASFGELGTGKTENIGDDESAASGDLVNVGMPVEQLAAGGFHTCALRTDRQVICWGLNNYGQLGYGHTQNIGDGETLAAVEPVDVGAPVVQIAAGIFHTCALLEGGDVRCWGNGETGRLGYGNLDDIGDDETPAGAGLLVDFDQAVTHLSLGGGHSCALLDNGKVQCWGAGAWGILGSGTQDIGDNELAQDTPPVPIGADAVQLEVGVDHTCVLLAEGTVRCWGHGNLGQLGYGDTQDIGDDESPAAAGDVDVGGEVEQMALGFDFTCVRLVDGGIKCWGGGAWGRLGYGNVDDIGDDEKPADVGTVPYL